MTITITWWMIPTLILIIGTILAHVKSGINGYLAGFDTIIYMIPVLFISLIAFIIAGILK